MRNLLILLSIFSVASCATKPSENTKSTDEIVTASSQPLLQSPDNQQEGAASSVADPASESRTIVVLTPQADAPGTYTYKGAIKGYKEVLLSLDGKKGEILAFHLKGTTTTYLNVYSPGGFPGKTDAMFAGPTNGTDAFLLLPADGSYLLQVFQMKPAAEKGTTSPFELKASVYPAAYAGLAADQRYPFVEVLGDQNLELYKKVNATDGSVSNDDVMVLLAPKQIVKLVGECAEYGDDVMYCRVEDAAGNVGWVNGNYVGDVLK